MGQTNYQNTFWLIDYCKYLDKDLYAPKFKFLSINITLTRE